MIRPEGTLHAWIASHEDKLLAAYVGRDAPCRAPATRGCATLDEARRWVEQEAAALGVTVEWVRDRGGDPDTRNRFDCVEAPRWETGR